MAVSCYCIILFNLSGAIALGAAELIDTRPGGLDMINFDMI
jgi:hypothetical protein